MNDQASVLRATGRDRVRLVRDTPDPRDCPAIVIGSGKGGVGKSILAITMSVALARTGRRILLVDGAQNLGNLHVLLGVRPEITPQALLHEDTEPEQLVMSVAPGLWLLPADSGAETVQRLGATDRARLHRRMTAVFRNFDAVVIDAAAGLDGAVRCATLHATRLVVVTVPEPAALTDAYALMKVVHGQHSQLPFDVLVNRVQHDDEGTTAFSRLETATRRFLGRGLHFIGSVPEDPAMRALACDPVALLDADGTSVAQNAVRQITATCAMAWTTVAAEATA